MPTLPITLAIAALKAESAIIAARVAADIQDVKDAIQDVQGRFNHVVFHFYRIRSVLCGLGYDLETKQQITPWPLPEGTPEFSQEEMDAMIKDADQHAIWARALLGTLMEKDRRWKTLQLEEEERLKEERRAWREFEEEMQVKALEEAEKAEAEEQVIEWDD